MEKFKRPLIGFAGPAGAGKTYLAQILVKNLGFQRRSYADKLRETASVLFSVPVHRFRTSKHELDPFWNMTYREMLQKLGTDACRNHIADDIWVKSFWRDSEVLGAVCPLVIDDVRFPDEARAIIDRGGIIYRVESDMAYAYKTTLWWQLWHKRHVSEKPLPWPLVYRTFCNDEKLRDSAADRLMDTVGYDIKTRWCV